MTTMIFGGSGFIGRRLIDLLRARGEEVVNADIAPPPDGTAGFVRCDLRRFDDVMAAMLSVRPMRTINLAYMLGSHHAPHVALQLNVVGMDNFFEASRLAEVEHVVFGSSLAVNGKQTRFGQRLVTEDDELFGVDYQYAVHKVFNERQAQDYREKHGMRITAVRPANVTGHDKVFGSVDHVRCITGPARGEAVSFPYRDAMRCPVHVDDVAEAVARITLADKPQHTEYNTGGTAVSLGELAELVREYVPEADISFEHETGGKADCTNYLIDNSRLTSEFGLTPRSARDCVVTILDALR
ncbi:NAD(P)-dependent oxidoreductase [Saccharomonospora sp. NPDC046836]|uniref:NAD-dependent epimerase/dehydratase family protein n=1 Tax=Saccharomonospora sp. NPDC046836 TaxID=3156921 RepID=UPI00340459C9